MEDDRYRLLHDGDVIEPGDEWLQEDAKTWLQSPGWCLGMKYRNGPAMLPARRLLLPKSNLTGQGGADDASK